MGINQTVTLLFEHVNTFVYKNGLAIFILPIYTSNEKRKELLDRTRKHSGIKQGERYWNK